MKSPSSAAGPADREHESAREAESGTRLSASQIHDNVMSQANEELDRAASSLFISSLASGLAIGFSFLGGAYASSVVSPAHAGAAMAAAYPLGFILVIMARSELFTENTLTPVLPLLHRRTAEALVKMLRVWVILLGGNLLGTLGFAWLMARTPALSAPLRQVMLHVADQGTSSPFLLTLYQAIFAGWLIALLTWVLASTHRTGAQLALIWLLTAPISAFGFKHSIVGSAEAFYRAWSGSSGWGATAGFIAAAVIGNTIGGVLLVALLNYGQVVTERHDKGQVQTEVAET
ncbi:MAG TPA: formate/nitrite transporter family protein [Gemmatimonadales bacterium]|nr:formate/nitrite transporter family protein [Gemmatimonadales bacterium]